MFEILTLAAIILGPIAAVFVTRFVDSQREKDIRRQEIFKTLMRTRRNPISSEHVGALNLIELEYASDQNVMQEWKKLFTHFGMNHVRRDDEIVSDSLPPEERMRRDTGFYRRLAEERQRQLAKLLHAMAKTLKFKAEQLDIFEGGYTPQGWGEIEMEQHAARRFILDLAVGRKWLPVGVFNYVDNSNSTSSSRERQTVPVDTGITESKIAGT